MMPYQKKMNEGSITLAANIITWLIITAGWFVVNNMNAARERRIETLGKIDKIINSIREIEKMGKLFHSDAKHNQNANFEITSQLQVLERSIQYVSILDTETIKRNIIEFRQACTLRNFDSSSFKQQSLNSSIVFEITGCARDLEDEINKIYNLKYPIKDMFSDLS
jgi:hypothetical protein